MYMLIISTVHFEMHNIKSAYIIKGGVWKLVIKALSIVISC